MDGGRVVERGTHDELLGRGGRYSSLWWDEMRTERCIGRRNADRSTAIRYRQTRPPAGTSERT